MKKIKTLKDELENAGWKIEEDIETPVSFEGFFLTLIRSSEVGLAMNIYLRCVENKDEPLFLRFQNDKNSRFNSNWVKMYLDGKIDNYEEKTIIFSEPELNDLKKWIHQNKKAITKHYYQEYDSADVCKKIKPLT